LLNALHEEGLSMDWFCFVDRDNGHYCADSVLSLRTWNSTSTDSVNR